MTPLSKALSEHQQIFIGGLHRSGTSLLFRTLRDHPQISGFKDTGENEDEGQFLQSVYPIARTYGGPGRFGFHPAARLNEQSPLATPDNAQKIFREWSRYWDLEKPYLLEKSPPNLIRSRFLQALFPDACFIMIIRHPLAVSYATQKWRARIPLYVLIWHWLVCHEQFESDKVHLRKLFTLHYEQLVANPQATLRQIYDFLGVLEVPLKQTVRAGINERYFLRWQEMRQATAIQRLYALMIMQFERRVNRFGYSLREINNRQAV